MFCCIKYTVSPTGVSDKSHNEQEKNFSSASSP